MEDKRIPQGFEETYQMIQKLQALHPLIFPAKPARKVPLAIGIYNQIVNRYRMTGTDQTVLRKAMACWCNGIRYYEACASFGAVRYNLDGTVQQPVDESSRSYAMGRLFYKELAEDK